MHKATSLFLVLAAASSAFTSVHAHGYVQEVVADGTTYTGYLPYQDPYMNPAPERIIRKIPSNGPVTDVTLIDLQCNGDSADGMVGTVPAPIYGTVEAGTSVALNWTAWPDSHVGPMITYMAAVPSGTDITEWLPGTAAVWFKVAEAGKTADEKWAATDILSANDSIYTFTVPASLKPGQYIVRHEIIALHGAFAYPGAQFYPSCIQFEVTGSGTASPSSSYLVAFPGAYTPETPGIVFDVYDNPDAPYPIPGPAV
ncbi:glycoside hydrolase [Fomitiporia mediterranea MF3/22]|uniref:glycoside hydrolase n=1 Tax=Fomitiporia mediterranea (strain MF3/22) TaxID=694068 RepID=UPI0004408780|nr:glycoside hydrolase [Fomitiporia mediterranea MF3/22]EJC98256.1 glycoside hydrolase [Fomitiporia mediterranea MF3/22]